MGIYMHLLVSGAVTPNEWRAAYQETLKLVRAFSLGELREKEVAGVPVYCLTPTEERTQPAAWRKKRRLDRLDRQRRYAHPAHGGGILPAP